MVLTTRKALRSPGISPADQARLFQESGGCGWYARSDLSDKIVLEGQIARWQRSGKAGSSAGWQQY